jgi:signal transduction histidine kinase/ligand-binding sensor domain-containing protein
VKVGVVSLRAIPWLLAASLAATPAAAHGAGQESSSAIPGFPAESITALYQDSAGLLWIGTRGGMVLHDGHSFEVFDHDVADPTSLSDNTVRTIYEDREGTLWLGTTAGGLNRLDRASWTFEHFRYDSADPRSLSHESVNVIFQDSSGVLWIGTQVGFNRFDPATETFDRLMHDPADPGSISHDYIYAIHEDSEGVLWIGTVGGGLNRRDPDTGRFTSYRHDPGDPSTLSSDEIFAITAGPDGGLWLGTEEGLNRLDPATGMVERFHPDPDDPNSLRNDLVTVQVRGAGETLWVGTWGGGVHLIDMRERAWLPEPSPARYPDLVEGRIASLLLDNGGTLWIGTWGGGLKRMPPTRDLFAFTGVTGGVDGLSHEDATAVVEDALGRLWVGTWGRGVDRRDPGEQTFRNYREDPSSGVSIGTVLEVCPDREGQLWVGTMNGLIRLDPDTGAMVRLAHDPADPTSLGAGYINAILEDRQGRLWVGTGEHGLNILREDGRTFRRMVHDPDDPHTLSDDYVTALYEDLDGRLWVGTRSGGLNILDAAGERFERYLPDPENDRSLSHHYVSAIAQDAEGAFWIATAGGGLNRADPDPDGARFTFSRLTEREGLVDNDVTSINPDDDGNLWLGTKDGLSRFEPSTGRFTSYGIADGLPATEFNGGSASAGREVLHFGTSHGLLEVRRGTPFPTAAPSPTLLRSIRTLEGPFRGGSPAWALDRLELPYGEILTLEFAVLDYADARHHNYMYRMEGLRDEWVDLGNRHEITFTDLNPGFYTLRVRGRNDQGVWSEAPTALAIDVVPPFWMTDWFRLLIVAAVAALAIVAHRVRTASLERRNRELSTLKDQRERALGEARASAKALHKAYDQLRDLTRRLEAAKEDERKSIARELHDEMGQALTAAKLNLQLLPAAADKEAATRRIDDTVSLVDRMIGHVRALSLDLRPPLLDELGLVPALRGYLEAQAGRSGLQIDVRAGTEPSGLRADLEIVAFRAVQEAVTNVMRHAEARRVDVNVSEDDGQLKLSVRDDGKGFDVASALERASGGQHIGLLGVRERVQSLGGELDIDSALGRGTELRIRIPVGS